MINSVCTKTRQKKGEKTYLLPQRLSGGQTGASSNKPAVTQLPLVQIVCTDAIDEQVRVLTQLLETNKEHVSSHDAQKLYWRQKGPFSIISGERNSMNVLYWVKRFQAQERKQVTEAKSRFRTAGTICPPAPTYHPDDLDVWDGLVHLQNQIFLHSGPSTANRQSLLRLTTWILCLPLPLQTLTNMYLNTKHAVEHPGIMWGMNRLHITDTHCPPSFVCKQRSRFQRCNKCRDEKSEEEAVCFIPMWSKLHKCLVL